MLRAGPGIKAVTNTAAEIFVGKSSIAWEIANPPRLWPTRITLSRGGRASMKSLNGLKKSETDRRSSLCFGLTPEAAKSSAVTLLWPEDFQQCHNLVPGPGSKAWSVDQHEVLASSWWLRSIPSRNGCEKDKDKKGHEMPLSLLHIVFYVSWRPHE